MRVQTIIKRLTDGKIKSAAQLDKLAEDLDAEERQQLRMAIAVLGIVNKRIKHDLEKSKP